MECIICDKYDGHVRKSCRGAATCIDRPSLFVLSLLDLTSFLILYPRLIQYEAFWFESDLSRWDTSNVETFRYMFDSACE